MAAKNTNSSNIKNINLALQGGGSHGAYTWGVLDRLLMEDDLHIEGVSGTSAGAMNAAVMVNGYAVGGRELARQNLRLFWQKIAEASAFSPMNKSVFERFLTGWNLDTSPVYHILDLMSHVVSPYDSNPLNINPLRGVLEEVLDLDALRCCSEMKLFVAATHVESGQARVFNCEEITIDVLLASSCLPQIFQAIEIDGEHYWDGGYMGNPVIWPLIYSTKSEDIVLVQINPIHRAGVPKQPMEIINRLNEISFNSSLIAEMRAIDFVSRLINSGALDKQKYKDIKMHLIYSPDELRELNASSKMNASWEFFEHLHGIGFEAATRWIKANKSTIGKHSSIDIREKFLGGTAKKNSK
jgi:NTE family protein